jgi:hypothetical protein
MTKRITVLLTTLVSLGVLAIAVNTYAQGTNAPAHPKGEQHPAIHRAVANLREARHALNEAKSEFGGHRTKAIKAVDEALEECRLALETGKK